jgi:hypothetical protein
MSGSFSDVSVAIGVALFGAMVLLAFLRIHLNPRLGGRVEPVLGIVVFTTLAWGVGHTALERDWRHLAGFMFVGLCIGLGIVRAQRRNKKLTGQRDRLRSTT